LINFFKRKLLFVLNNYIRTNSSLTRLIFGVKVKKKERIHWDFTTILLKKCLRLYVKPGMKILEIGTGPFALLSIFLSKKYNCPIDACDVNYSYVKSSLQTAKENNVKINLIKSDLFKNIDDTYDIIFFNSVYIPLKVGKRLGINDLHNYESDWCGGKEGTEVIEEFIKNSKKHLNKSGKVLLGINFLYLDKEIIKKICNLNDFNIELIYEKSINPSSVLILI
jgi:release factor glutamine methyltransferase